MTAPLYNTAILRLAATIPHGRRLEAPQATVEKRSPVCGSRVTVDVNIDADGRICAFGQEVRACALGQASASVMGSHAVGRTGAELVAAEDDLAEYLTGRRADPGDWPGLAIFAAARAHPSRHAAILLPFAAAAEAAERAWAALAADKADEMSA